MDSEDQNLYSWDRFLRSDGCAIARDSIHAAKHLFSALQLYYHGFLCQDHSFPPTFLVLVLAMMANKKVKIFS